MKHRATATSIAESSPGDGTYAGARKLYLARGLRMTLIERLRAVEQMAETAKFLQRASANKCASADSLPNEEGARVATQFGKSQ